MEVSPKTFREVEFREKMRGYHPEDVDQFLEQMATAVEAINERLQQADERARQADDRAKRAEAAAESGNGEETLRRTLVLAQRTADLAIQEARDEAGHLVASAEQQAQTILSEAEDRARRLHGEALADVHAELAKLEATRTQAQQEVDALSLWATEHRAHLSASLKEALAQIDRAGLLAPPPSSSPIDVPSSATRSPRDGAAVGPPPSALPPSGLPSSGQPSSGESSSPPPPSPPERPVTEGRSRDRAPVDPGPGSEGRSRDRTFGDSGPATQAVPAVAKAPESEPAGSGLGRESATPNDEGIDDLFDNGELDNGPRFGGRLRRRH